MPMDPERDGEMRALLRESVAARAVDPARAERVRAAVHTEWRAHHAPGMVPWRLWTGLAATAAAVFAVVVFLPGDRPGNPALDAPPDDAAVATVGSDPQVMPEFDLSIEAAERDQIRKALEAAGGKRMQAARLLGLSRRTLYRKLDKYGIT